MEVREMDTGWTPLQETIREVLYRYFGFFGKVYSFVSIRLLNFADLNFFFYYFELMGYIDKYKGSNSYKRALEEYLKA
jgi:hypothetical protein